MNLKLKRKIKVLVYRFPKVRIVLILMLYTVFVYEMYNAVGDKPVLYLLPEGEKNLTTNRNLSFEYICRNNYAPRKGAGKNGEPLELSSAETVFAQGLYAFQGYNVLVSDRISINRSLPDMRSKSCKLLNYDINKLPSASVVIVFYNEVWSALMRTVISVLKNSRDKLIKEIILVDDGSEREYLGTELDEAIIYFAKVRVLRIKIRKGLVGARLEGARNATGDVLLFLDAHCEVTVGWLEPLLHQATIGNVFAVPHINNIDADTLEFNNNFDEQYGTFNWELAFRWSIPNKDILKATAKNNTQPYPTPVMPGGLFAVKRRLFWDLGSYDDGLQIWGSENLELSWRAWQCGARIEVVPCSKVGHIFRTKSPYIFSSAKKVNLSNLARVALVWMDKWTNFVFKISPRFNSVRKNINITNRLELRKKLKCNGFEWFLTNVWPTHYFPTDQRWFGKIKNKRGACLGLLKGPAFGISCNNTTDTYLLFTAEGSYGKIMGNEDLCLEQGNGQAFWNLCQVNKKQLWKRNGQFLKTEYGACLTLITRKYSKIEVEDDLVTAKKCAGDDTGQVWYFIPENWY